MALDIKICGLKTLPALNAALDGGASHVGFIFFPRSPRNIAPGDAGTLRAAMAGHAQAVAVTVDADDALLDEIVHAMSPDLLQLHGSETPERVAAIKARWGLPVMKAVSVREAADLAGLDAYRGIADSFLFDAKPPQDALLPGGNGVSFDWTLLKDLPADTPFFLSGGLHSGNVAEAIRLSGARAVDASSGVETAPGTKDVGLIQAFLHTARQSSVPRAAVAA